MVNFIRVKFFQLLELRLHREGIKTVIEEKNTFVFLVHFYPLSVVTVIVLVSYNHAEE